MYLTYTHTLHFCSRYSSITTLSPNLASFVYALGSSTDSKKKTYTKIDSDNHGFVIKIELYTPKKKKPSPINLIYNPYTAI